MTELTYLKTGDYLIPNLILEKQEEQPSGKYWRMRRDYLREHRPVLWNRLILSGSLYSHLRETEEAANRRLELLMPELAKAAGATESLKASDPMMWVGLMNACKEQAEEVIFTELIFS